MNDTPVGETMLLIAVFMPLVDSSMFVIPLPVPIDEDEHDEDVSTE